MPRCRPVERGEGETGDMGVGVGVVETAVLAAGAGVVNMAAPRSGWGKLDASCGG